MKSSTDSTFYTICDYLGSIMVVADENGTSKEEYSYDAWGRRRNKDNWTYSSVSAPTYITRGYTGHEHIEEVGLINMNGRVYDPLVGLFLSPDPIVQSPYDVLNYNRYSYVGNNPLKYTDPSGYYKQMPRQLQQIVDVLMGFPYDGEWDENNGYRPHNSWDEGHSSGTGYMNEQNAWGTHGAASSEAEYFSNFYDAVNGNTNIKAISTGGYTLNNPGSDFYYKFFDHLDYSGSTIINSNTSLSGNSLDKGHVFSATGLLATGTFYEAAYLIKRQTETWVNTNKLYWLDQEQLLSITCNPRLLRTARIADHIAFGTSIITTGLTLRKIAKGDNSFLNWTDFTIGTMGLSATVAKYLSGAQIPGLGFYIATYGAVRFSWDIGYNLGIQYGPITNYKKKHPKSIIYEYMKENGMLND